MDITTEERPYDNDLNETRAREAAHKDSESNGASDSESTRNQLGIKGAAGGVCGRLPAQTSSWRSKTDQEAAGCKIGIPFGADPATCPVASGVGGWSEQTRIYAHARGGADVSDDKKPICIR